MDLKEIVENNVKFSSYKTIVHAAKFMRTDMSETLEAMKKEVEKATDHIPLDDIPFRELAACVHYGLDAAIMILDGHWENLKNHAEYLPTLFPKEPDKSASKAMSDDLSYLEKKAMEYDIERSKKE